MKINDIIEMLISKIIDECGEIIIQNMDFIDIRIGINNLEKLFFYEKMNISFSDLLFKTSNDR